MRRRRSIGLVGRTLVLGVMIATPPTSADLRARSAPAIQRVAGCPARVRPAACPARSILPDLPSDALRTARPLTRNVSTSTLRRCTRTPRFWRRCSETALENDAARGPTASVGYRGRGEHRMARSGARPRGPGASEPGPPCGAQAEPRRVRQRRSRPAGSRGRRHRAAARIIRVPASTTSRTCCSVSPSLLEAYLAAARKIGRLALGNTGSQQTIYRVSP